MTTVHCSPPEAADREAWAALYRGYALFYRVPMPELQLDTLWGWLQDPAHEVRGLLARDDRQVLGLAHFRRYPRPLRAGHGLFLDDLYVAEPARGRGVGRALIEAVSGVARSEGLNPVRWITADDNHRARMLYDSMATRTWWVTYDRELV